MKKLKLKKWVKVVLTVMILLISLFVYSKAGYLGELGQTNRYYILLAFFSWIWLILGQFIVISMIWNEE